MITIFHIIPIAVLIWGAFLGYDYYSWLGAIGGAMTGLVIGVLSSQILIVIGLRSMNLQGQSTEKLRTHLHDGVWPGYHLIFAELKLRGEEISNELDVVLSLLNDDSYQKRLHGWTILSRYFPDLAEQIPDYNPVEPAEVCRSKAQKFSTL
jgi:hypothetical protein